MIIDTDIWQADLDLPLGKEIKELKEEKFSLLSKLDKTEGKKKEWIEQEISILEHKINVVKEEYCQTNFNMSNEEYTAQTELSKKIAETTEKMKALMSKWQNE